MERTNGYDNYPEMEIDDIDLLVDNILRDVDIDADRYASTHQSGEWDWGNWYLCQ